MFARARFDSSRLSSPLPRRAQTIRRLDVNAPGAEVAVREARQAGLPLILVGHDPGSFPRFASSWLKPRSTPDSRPDGRRAGGDRDTLDVERMRAELADEQARARARAARRARVRTS